MSGQPQVQKRSDQGLKALSIIGLNIKPASVNPPNPPNPQNPPDPSKAEPARPRPRPTLSDSKNPVVVRPMIGPALIQRAFAYSWDDVMQILAAETYQFKDEEVIQKHKNIIRAFLPATPPSSGPSDGNGPKAWEKEITKGLNQLTKDTYWSVMDRLTPRSRIVNSNYLKLLVSKIWGHARDHLAYATLYAEFLVAVKWELEQNAGEEQQKTYSSEILRHVQEFLSTVKDAHKSEESWSLFVGYLGRKKFLEMSLLRDTIKRLLAEPVQDEDLENAGRMMILCGKLMEENYPTDVAAIFDNFHTFSRAKHRFTGRARYFLVDIENVRSDDWNEREIQRILNLLPPEVPSGAGQTENTGTSFVVSRNRFADLQDEEDFVEDEFVDWEGAVRQYVVDKDVPEIGGADNEQAVELLFAVACSQPRDLATALELLSVLQEREWLVPDKIDSPLEVIKKVVKRCTEGEVRIARRQAIANCGGILAQLVMLGLVDANDFGEVFTEFNLEVIDQFMSRICACKQIEVISESKYWSSYKWRPEVMVSQMKIADMLDGIDARLVDEVFSMYADLLGIRAVLTDALTEEWDTAKIEEEIRLLSEEIQPSVLERPALAAGVMEMLITGGADLGVIQLFLKLGQSNCPSALLWLEWYGVDSKEQVEQIADRIKGVVEQVKPENVDEYWSMEGTAMHAQIVAAARVNK